MLLFFSLLLLFVGPCAAALKACPPVPPLLPFPASLKQLFADKVVSLTKPLGPGVQVALTYRNETVQCFARGFSDVNAGTTMTCDTRMRVASVTKVFSTLAAFLLREKKVVRSLDDFVFPREEFTYRELMSHMGGVANGLPCAPNFSGSGVACNLTLADALKLSADWIQIQGPWQGKSYANFGFALLGQQLAALTGATFEQMVEKLIFSQLGMTNSTFDVLLPAAKGYMAGTNVSVPLQDLGFANPTGKHKNDVSLAPVTLLSIGGLMSTANDLARLLQFIVSSNSEPDLLPRDVVRQWIQPVSFAGPTLAQGMPWEMTPPSSSLSRAKYWHRGKFGADTAWNAYMGFVAELELGVVVLVNSGVDPAATEAAHAILDLISDPLLQYLIENQVFPRWGKEASLVGSYLSPFNFSSPLVAGTQLQLSLPNETQQLKFDIVLLTRPDNATIPFFSSYLEFVSANETQVIFRTAPGESEEIPCDQLQGGAYGEFVHLADNGVLTAPGVLYGAEWKV